MGDWTVVGREAELARLDRFVREALPGTSIVLIGGPGIGKTTVWQAALHSAREEGIQVLAARPGGSDAQLAFGGLIDLCDRLGEPELSSLPAAQRAVLEDALMRGASGAASPSSAAVEPGLLGVLRALAERSPVLVAVDDLQWLDPASERALTFVARRLGGLPVGFLLARRPGQMGLLENALARGALERIELGPLSLGAVRSLLFERLGLTISRQRLRQIVDATAGNPLFALEFGRALADGRQPLSDGVPVPDSLDQMLGDRVRRLGPAARRVLLALALSEDPRTERILHLVELDALDRAVDAGAVVVEGERVRPAHPLLAAAAEQQAGAGERRTLHLALADLASSEAARVMHLALATTTSDRPLALRLAAAAEAARVLGARAQAAVLAGHALRLAPAGVPERDELVISLAARLEDAGELLEMSALLKRELPTLPPGPLRARALLHLGSGDDVTDRPEQDRYSQMALAESGADRNLRAHALARLAANTAAGAVEHLGQAEAWAREAVELATDRTARRDALSALAWALGLAGADVTPLCAESGATTDPSAYILASPERVAAQQLVWRGEIARARATLIELRAIADAGGDLYSYGMVRLHLIEAELRAGRLAAAAPLLDEWGESDDLETQFYPQLPRCRALLEVCRGAPAPARKLAEETIRLAQAAGVMWDELEARRARGIAALLDGMPDQAVEDLSWVWRYCEREGVREPGVFPVAPELVEGLFELGQLDEAAAVTGALGERAAELDHPWASASTKRCAGLVRGDDALLREAAVDLEQLGVGLDAARCLFALGRVQRRRKKWRRARETLAEAAAAFTALGAEGWATQARAELERVGGRRKADDLLTPSEQRTVQLAADGLSNKEIAAALNVTVNTVEVYLTRAYAKLGVHSRNQLARRLAAG